MRSIIPPTITALLVLCLSACGTKTDSASESDQQHAEHGSGASHPDPSGNVVQQEMQLLTAALESAVRGIGTGDVRPLEHELHRVHAAKQATEAAIADGSYKPPKNPDALDRFTELDEAFHDELRKLVAASRANDLSATADALGGVLRSCEGCHSEFRP